MPVIDLSPPEGDETSKGLSPFRCSKCNGYFNVHSIFENMGTKVKCNLCHTSQDVPVEHQGPIDQYGKREDRDNQSQYFYGTFEYILSPKMIDKIPVKPRYVFCFDISATAIINGLFY